MGCDLPITLLAYAHHPCTDNLTSVSVLSFFPEILCRDFLFSPICFSTHGSATRDLLGRCGVQKGPAAQEQQMVGHHQFLEKKFWWWEHMLLCSESNFRTWQQFTTTRIRQVLKLLIYWKFSCVRVRAYAIHSVPKKLLIHWKFAYIIPNHTQEHSTGIFVRPYGRSIPI
jgi:hypothetical protein